jgi:hypothetical protein
MSTELPAMIALLTNAARKVSAVSLIPPTKMLL